VGKQQLPAGQMAPAYVWPAFISSWQQSEFLEQGSPISMQQVPGVALHTP